MAGDWIKMRAALADHPKVIAISRLLMDDRAFREWLTPGGSGLANGQLVSDAASRLVTCGALLKVWSIAREHGVFEGPDLILEHSRIPDLDAMSGVPGLGKALQAVQWAERRSGVTLPNFKEYNVPMDGAERQRRHRRRITGSDETVTDAPLRKRDKRVTRGEKRREVPVTDLERDPQVWSDGSTPDGFVSDDGRRANLLDLQPDTPANRWLKAFQNYRPGAGHPLRDLSPEEMADARMRVEDLVADDEARAIALLDVVFAAKPRPTSVIQAVLFSWRIQEAKNGSAPKPPAPYVPPLAPDEAYCSCTACDCTERGAPGEVCEWCQRGEHTGVVRGTAREVVPTTGAAVGTLLGEREASRGSP